MLYKTSILYTAFPSVLCSSDPWDFPYVFMQFTSYKQISYFLFQQGKIFYCYAVWFLQWQHATYNTPADI